MTLQERPMGDGIAPEVAPRPPVEISVGINQPIVYEGIDGTVWMEMPTGRHVLRNGFAPHRVRENRDALFEGKLVTTFARKAAFVDAKTGMIPGAGQDPHTLWSKQHRRGLDHSDSRIPRRHLIRCAHCAPLFCGLMLDASGEYR